MFGGSSDLWQGPGKPEPKVLFTGRRCRAVMIDHTPMLNRTVRFCAAFTWRGARLTTAAEWTCTVRSCATAVSARNTGDSIREGPGLIYREYSASYQTLALQTLEATHPVQMITDPLIHAAY